MKTVQKEMPTSASNPDERQKRCHISYHSVSSQLMQPEIRRYVTGVSADMTPTGGNDSDTEKLLRALSRYTKSNERSIAFGEDVATLVNAVIETNISDGVTRRRGRVTYVSPSQPITGIGDNNTDNDSDTAIPSLLNCKDKEIAQSIPQETEILYLSNPNPINGEVYSVSQIRRILDNVGAVRVIVDESLFEYCGSSAVSLLRDYSNLLILRSLSEAFGLAETPFYYLLGDASLISAIKKIIPVDAVPSVTKTTALAALNRPDVMRRSVETVCENRVYLTTLLRRLGVKSLTSPLHFILAEVEQTDLALDALRRFGVTDCIVTQAEKVTRYLRIPIGNESYCRSVIAAFTRFPREYYVRTKRETHAAQKQFTLTSRRNSNAPHIGVN